MKKFLLGLTLIAITLPMQTMAAEYTIRPFLIDTVLEQRDIETHLVKLVNNAEFTTQTIYATVNEISVDLNGEIKNFVTPVMTDETRTVTSWIEVTRGVIEVPAGEEREVPVTFRINPKAEPGEYHAFIGFVSAPNRPAAQSVAMAGEADGVVVKIVIADDRTNSLHVNGFLVDRFVIGDQSRLVDVAIENLGDLHSIPTGEIIFYDSRGVEVASAPVNATGAGVSPGDTLQLQALVPNIQTPGRFKANLALKYGDGQQAALYDTTFFYVIPWHLMLLTAFAITLVTLIIFYLFRRVFIDESFDIDDNDVTMYIKDGHHAEPKDHDIDLKNNA